MTGGLPPRGSLLPPRGSLLPPCAPGVSAFLLLRWACSYARQPSILGRPGGGPAFARAVALALWLFLYATRGVSFWSSTSYGPSRSGFWSAFSSSILPFGVDSLRHSGAGVAYRRARRGWTWPPRLVCSILFSGLRGCFSDALSALRCLRPLRGRASGDRASRVYFLRCMAARGALSLVSSRRRGVLARRVANRHVAVGVRLGVRLTAGIPSRSFSSRGLTVGRPRALAPPVSQRSGRLFLRPRPLLFLA